MTEVKDKTPTGAPQPASPPNKGGSSQYQRIYSEIEESADYYEPSIYSVLTYCDSTVLNPDSLAQDFVPISPTAYKWGDSKRRGLMFVVGLLPPTSNISSRLLDRSGTVASMLGVEGELADFEAETQEVDPGADGGYIVTAPGYAISVSDASADLGIGVTGGEGVSCDGSMAIEVDKNNPKMRVYHGACITKISMREMFQGLHDAYVRKYRREPTATEIQFMTAHCWRETSGSMPGNNPGMIGNKCGAYPGGPYAGFQHKDDSVCWFRTYANTAEGFDAYLRIAGRNPNVFAAARQGDILGFLTSLAQTEYFGEPLNLYYNNYGKGGGYPALLNMVSSAVPEASLGRGDDLPTDVPDACGFKETTVAYRKRTKSQTKELPKVERNGKTYSDAAVLSRFNRNSPYGSDCPLEGAIPYRDSGTTNDWKKGGSDNATKAEKEEAKLAAVRANRENLGRRFGEAQIGYIRAAQAALETMKRMPPLRMLVNPKQFSVSCEKIIADGNRSRTGNIVEHWGDGQDKLEGSGEVSGFYSGSVYDARAPGLTRSARSWSASFQNFLSLWLLYRNNGGIYLPENVTGDKKWETMNLAMLGSIYIYYDGVLYLGSFDTFDITETDDLPHSLEYSFSFTVRAWFLLDRQDEGDFGYGAPEYFKVSRNAPQTGGELYAKQAAAAEASGAARKEAATKARDEAYAQDPARLSGLGTLGVQAADNPPAGGPRTSGGQRPKGKAGGQSGPPKNPNAPKPATVPTKTAPPATKPSGGGEYEIGADGIVRPKGGGSM